MSPSPPPDDGFVAGVRRHAEAIVERPERPRPPCALVDRAGEG